MAVLQRAQEPQRTVAITFQHEHGINEVLQRAWPGERAVLGDMADEQHGHPLVPGKGAQPGCRLAHLADRTRRAIELIDCHRLDRIDDQQGWSAGCGRLDDGSDIRAREDGQRATSGAIDEPQSEGTQQQLRGQFLGTGVEHLAPRREGSRDLEHQRGLADAGLAGEEQQRAWHEPAAQQAVHLGHPRRPACQGPVIERVKRSRLGRGLHSAGWPPPTGRTAP